MNDPYIEKMAEAFEEELRKIAGLANAEVKAGKSLIGHLPKRDLAIAGAGILGYRTLSQAEQDRRMGKQIRKQQGY